MVKSGPFRGLISVTVFYNSFLLIADVCTYFLNQTAINIMSLLYEINCCNIAHFQMQTYKVHIP